MLGKPTNIAKKTIKKSISEKSMGAKRIKVRIAPTFAPRQNRRTLSCSR